MTEKTSTKTNIVELDVRHPIQLHQGDLFDTNSYPGSVFMLVSGSIGIRVPINTLAGFDMKQVAVLNVPGSDIFGDQRTYTELLNPETPITNVTSDFEYVALEESSIRIIPLTRFKQILSKHEDPRGMVVALKILETKMRQIFRLMELTRGSFQAAADSRQRELEAYAQNQRTGAYAADAARCEERMRYSELEKRAENERTVATQLTTSMFSAMLRELNRLWSVETSYKKLQRNYRNVCADYIEATGAFHEMIEGQHRDANNFVDMLNEFQRAQNLPELTHEDIFGVLSGRGIHPQERFTPEEKPKSRAKSSTSLGSDRGKFMSSGHRDAVTKREGSGRPPLLDDEEVPPKTLIAGAVISQTNEEQLVDEYGERVRDTLVGIAPPSEVDEHLLPPEMRKSYPGNSAITPLPPITKRR